MINEETHLQNKMSNKIGEKLTKQNVEWNMRKKLKEMF